MSEEADRENGGTASHPGAHQAIYFYGVARAKTWRGGRGGQVEGSDVLRIRYRDLDALVRPVPYEIPFMDDARLQEHQKVVEAAMRRGTVLPAPYGIVFRGRRQLIHLLQDQYLVLDEGLSFLDGHWELRLHMAAAAGDDIDLELSDLSMELYSELRRHAHAAVPFATQGRRLLSAAFLVERASWVDFVERAEDLAAAHAELTFDITGPWPPYDFVRITT
ncbi:MAG: GvpL/GvpF family gas vesicle protein [Gemmatimonadetes bacterium]|nr:GvpL/GvpF family gas vesicle protein [Gemmatimonadota bacterium]